MEKAVLQVTVSPKSSRSRITLDNRGIIKIYLNSPPVDGKANAEMIKLLSKTLGVAKTSIEIKKGLNSKRKILEISGLDIDYVLDKLKKD